MARDWRNAILEGSRCSHEQHVNIDLKEIEIDWKFVSTSDMFHFCTGWSLIVVGDRQHVPSRCDTP
jgi:hypothetical protein